MKKLLVSVLMIIGCLLLPGCGGGSGSSAPAPTGVTVQAGDNNVTVTWNPSPGVEYWLFGASGVGVITPQNCIYLPNCKIFPAVSSPLVLESLVTGLINGSTYSFTINGRTGGGIGGPGSSAVQVTPRLAGATWTSNPVVGAGAQNLRGVAYGSVFVAVGANVVAGANGALFSSVDGVTWTSLTLPASLPAGTSFNAISYSGGKYVVVGTGGVILLSTDAVTWTQQAIGSTPNDLYAVAGNGSGGFVATGASGTILSSVNGSTWTVVPVVAPIPANALYGVSYGNGKYVVVGALGTLLTSTNGTTWVAGQANSPIPAADLKSIAYGLPLAAYGYLAQDATVGTFVAVGVGGALVTSTDGGATWTPRASISPNLLNAVTFGHQFIALDNLGDTFTSTDGLTWQHTQPASASLNAIAPARLVSGSHTGLYVYSVVGASGVNMLAK